jgi:hypothetical protein
VRLSIDRPEKKKPLRLFEGITDGQGRILAEVTLPDKPAKGEILVTAEAELGTVEKTIAFPRKEGS